MSSVPEAKFQSEKAIRYFPRPDVKWAVLVPVHPEFPTFIQPEWDTEGNCPQVFIGDYYLIIDDAGRGRYGSAQIQWENMHRRVPFSRHLGARPPATGWVKVLCPMGYEVDEACELVTLIPTSTSEIRESRKLIQPGTLVLRQPGGEFQFVRPVDRAATYYEPAEADKLGLTPMTPDEFTDWVVAQATRQLAGV